ncbi:hypothetical protein I6A84_22005 [Frankia sp. CNm7]|uniref:hypothetical protein n=1 Tax=Frankia nepalensis TaxID=1836974 RepID=UPI0019317F2B|nr:hypothetical protein [Frankia nepalensis]MBL7520685.1 hypothetical protein [Frankia nepalensis]
MTVIAAVLVAALAGCQSSGSPKSKNTKGPDLDDVSVSVTATAAPSTAPAVLRAADFVLGEGPETSAYTMEPDTDPTEASLFEDPIPTCMELSQSDLGGRSTDHANGPVFTDDAVGTNIRSFAAVYASTSTVSKHRELVRHDRFAGCWGRALVDELISDGDDATLLGTNWATPPAGATDRIQIQLTLLTEGTEIELHVDMVTIFTGQVESTIFIINPFEPIDESVLGTLTNQVEKKIAKQ